MSSVAAPTRERTIWNIFFNIVSQILILGTAFITTPMIVQELGADSYGVVVLLSTVLLYMGFLDLGLSGAIIRYLTECVSANDWERFRRITWSALITYLGISLIGGLMLFFLIPQMVFSWLNIPQNLQSSSVICFYIFIFVFVVVFLTQTPQAIIWAYNRIDLAATLSFLNGILQPVVAIFMVFADYGIIGVAVATLTANVATLILAAWLSSRLYKGWGKPIYDIQSLKPLIKYGSWLTYAQIVNQAVSSLDKVLIGKFLNTAAVGYYNLSVTIPLKLWIIHGAFASSVLPLLVGLKTRSASSTEIFHLMSRLIRSVQLVLLPITLFFIFWGDTFLSSWINDEVAQAGKFSIRFASMAMILMGINAIYHTFLRAWGRVDLSTISYIGTAIAYLPSLYLCVRWLGISGAGLALIIYALIEILLLLIFMKSIVRIPLFAWLPGFVNRHLFTISAIGALIALLRPLFGWKPLWNMVILGGTFLMLSGLYVWFMGFSKSDRESILKSILGRFVSRANS